MPVGQETASGLFCNVQQFTEGVTSVATTVIVPTVPLGGGGNHMHLSGRRVERVHGWHDLPIVGMCLDGEQLCGVPHPLTSRPAWVT